MRRPPHTTRVRRAAPAEKRQLDEGLLKLDENERLSDECVSGEGVSVSLPINESTPKKILAVLIEAPIQADQMGPAANTRTRGSC